MEFDLARLLRLARRWGILLVLLAVLGGVAGAALSFTRPIEYASTSTLLLSPYSPDQPIFGNDVNQGLRTQTETYNYLLSTRPFLDQVAVSLGLDAETGPDEIWAAMSTVISQSVPTIAITVTGTDPDQTTLWANTIAATFLSFVQTSNAAADAAGTPWVALSIPAPASGPGAVVAPSRPMWVLLGIILGGLFGATLVLVIEHLRAAGPGVRRPTALPVLAVVDTIRTRTPGGRVLVDLEGGSEAARGVAQLRSAVQVLTATQGIRTLAISSLRPGEGKSTIAANLAVALAQGGDRVILIDANLDAPHLGETFGTGARAGLSTLMADPAMDLADAVSGTNWPNLMFIAAGPRMTDGVLDRSAFRRVIAGIVPHADLVIYEAPALAGEGDRMRLAGMADGTLLVVGGERTRIEALRAIANEKVTATTNVVGVVIDRGVGAARATGEDAVAPGPTGLTLVAPTAGSAATGSRRSEAPPWARMTTIVRTGDATTGVSDGNANGNGNGVHAPASHPNGNSPAGTNGYANGNGSANGHTNGLLNGHANGASEPEGLVRTVRAVPIADPDGSGRSSGSDASA